MRGVNTAKPRRRQRPSLARLVRALQRHRITQARIARVAGVHFTTVNKVLAGTTVSAHVVNTAQLLLDVARARAAAPTNGRAQ